MYGMTQEAKQTKQNSKKMKKKKTEEGKMMKKKKHVEIHNRVGENLFNSLTCCCCEKKH
jgi:hypothetical protein